MAIQTNHKMLQIHQKQEAHFLLFISILKTSTLQIPDSRYEKKNT